MKSLVTELARRGPHRVQRGDMAIAGQPGVVFTPAEGLGLPAVAFGHGWITGVESYRGLLEHLASWGIVAAAPNGERGLLPSHLGLAADLRTTLDICTKVRLGSGDISVHPDKLALAGHGMGAGAAVLAAAQYAQVKAVAALFPAPTAPAAESIAPSITVPGLILGGGKDISAIDSNATKLAAAWGGDAILRSVDKATGNGLLERRRVLNNLGFGKPEKTTQKTAKALLTGFLLYTLTGDKTYKSFAESDVVIPKTHIVDPLAEEAPQKSSPIKALLGR